MHTYTYIYAYIYIYIDIDMVCPTRERISDSGL